MNTFLTILLTGVLSANLAFAESKEVGNGGNEVGIEFEAAFQTALQTMKEKNVGNKYSYILKINFKKSLPRLKIVSVDQLLISEADGITQESTAINFPANQLIKINSERWKSISNQYIKQGLALHEVLSLLGIEGTGNYRYSAIYASEFGVSSESLEQRFQVSTETEEYSKNVGGYKVDYKVIATARWLTNLNYFEAVRIDYSVLVNGNATFGSDSISGRLFLCSYDKTQLPKDFLKITSVQGENIGFLVGGLGECGAASSYIYHFVVPAQAAGPGYDSIQFQSKTEPILRKKGNDFEIWYLRQEGVCGTALQFYVPNLILKPHEEWMEKSKLPKDISLIPQFQGFQITPFSSLFVAGVQTRDAELMRYAVQFYPTDRDEMEAVVGCELPSSPAQALTEANSMRILGNTLEKYGR